MSHVCILGAGAFGTSLAAAFARAGQKVTLWSRSEDLAKDINAKKINTKYWPSIMLPNDVGATSQILAAMDNSEVVVYACPSTEFRNLLKANSQILKTKILVDASKGIEAESLRFHHEIAREVFGEAYQQKNFACLSGPSFAAEIMNDLPTVVSVASTNEMLAKTLQQQLGSPHFRILRSLDVTGAELGGALKNVLAIAVGASEGLGYGLNSQAALITRGLSELSRLGLAIGCKAESFLGLACLGDLVLTCTGALSRNRSFGLFIGKGMSVTEARQKIGSTIEGYNAAVPAFEFSKRLRLDMPISTEVYEVLYNKKPIREAIESLTSRPQGEEWRAPKNLRAPE